IMLSIFPSLIIFGIFAPFILRVTVGIYLFYVGYAHLRNERESVTQEASHQVGSFAKALIIIGGIFEVTVGLSLIAGFLTQAMAIAGMIYILILLQFEDRCPVYVKHEKVFYIILFAIFFSLLLTGAGAPAVDLPL
ncbi:DoxX family membrane protein, partial [candidate division KSB1 bacterium]